MARLTLCLLGSFEVTLDGHPLTAFVSDKARALLAYLAVESGRAHSREKLVGLLWPDSPEAAARANLSHVLTNLRQLLSDRDAQPPFLLASRQSIQFSRESSSSVDVTAFEVLASRQDPSGPERAASLYRGRFLEGFSLPGSSEFEEWLLLEQEHLHRLAMGALARLVTAYEAEGQIERALTFAWRQLELDPSWESAHRQTMRLLAQSGQRDAALAQYQACRRLLAEELAAKPSRETVSLFEQIRDGQVPAGQVQRAQPAQAPEPRIGPEERPWPLPGFVTGQVPAATRPVFVGREKELGRLAGLLEEALSGHGQAAFVIGGPGRGKTALLQEFARRSMEAHPDLLLAMGTCNAYSGIGDPYLPFRGMLSMLTGDVEAAWASGILRGDQARRMWEALPDMALILSMSGSGLVGTLLPGRELLGRARAAASGEAGWVPPLERLADPRTNPPGRLAQSHLFQQYGNVLLDLSARHPLLLVLDDLQWTDPASTALLFYLGRRIEGGRILLTVAYRPHELALGREVERHPLEPVLADYRARFGDAWLDLAAADEVEGRTFVERFLDSEPNVLGEGFRAALFSRTRGHPLFTVELLRAMQTRGDLVHDVQGCWVEGDRLDWDALPVRTEAAIAERIARLPKQLREILAVASVEGEEFTAQAVAAVLGLDELHLLRTLREELDARHRLVRQMGERRVDQRTLCLYRFAHYLTQQHVYHELGDSERRLLHRRVGVALEQIYCDRLEDIAVQLARHFDGDPEREWRYSILAGEQAAARFAFREAARHLERGLELSPSLVEGSQAEGARARASLCCRLGQAYIILDRYSEAEERLQAAITLAQQAEDRLIEGQATAWLGLLRAWLWDRLEAERLLRRSLVLTRETGDQATEAFSTRHLSSLLADTDRPGEAADLVERSRALYEQMGDRQGLASALLAAGNVARFRGDWEQAERCYDTVVAMPETDPINLPVALLELGNLARHRGAFELARGYAERAKVLSIEYDRKGVVAYALYALGSAATGEGKLAEACSYLEQGIAVNREIADPAAVCWGQADLGCVLARQGKLDAAWELLQEVVRQSLSMQIPELTVYAVFQTGLSGVHAGQLQHGAELLGLAFRAAHASCQLPKEAKQELGMLRERLGTDRLEAALARGAGLDLDRVAAAIVACDTPKRFWETGLGGNTAQIDAA